MPNRDNLALETDLNPNIQSFIPEGELSAALNTGYVSRSATSPAPSPAPSPPPNGSPYLNFDLFREDIYTNNFTLSDVLIVKGSVQDPDGFTDLDRLELRAFYRDSDYNNRVFDFAPITQFTPDSNSRAIFEYNVDLKQLPLDEGFHNLTLEVIAYDRAGNGSRDRRDFSVFNSSPLLTIDYNPWLTSPVITFNNARVEDRDGLQDLDRIDFRLKGGDRIIDVADVTEFIGDFPYSYYGTFDYTLDLSRLNLPHDVPEWILQGQLYDKAGNYSYWQSHSLQVPQAAPKFSFNLNQWNYSAHETLSLEYPRIDNGGDFEDIDRIDFQLILDRHNFNPQIIDIADVTEFQSNPNGDFNYDFDLSSLQLPLGNYEASLKGILHDRWGNHFERSQIFYIANNAPSFSFYLNNYQYSFADTLTLTNTYIEDLEGLADLDRIDFQVHDVKNNRILDVADVVTFNSFRFDYSLDLKTLDLPPRPDRNNYNNYNYYDLVLQGIAYDKAGNSSELKKQNFSVKNSFPEQFQFNLDRTTYIAGETLSITGGQVKDGDGFDDLDRIEFRLRVNSGLGDRFIDLPDITALSPNLYDRRLAHFDYNFTLDNLPLPTGYYGLTLEAIAYDRVGNSSEWQVQHFSFDNRLGQWDENTPIPSLHFQLDRSQYIAGETLTLEEAWVENYNDINRLDNDINRLDRIDFYLQSSSGHVIDIANITQFNLDVNNPDRAVFNYSLDLNNLGLIPDNSYDLELIGIVYEESGLGSIQQTANFRVGNYTPDFNFSINSYYNHYYEDAAEKTLTLTDTWVEDYDGLSNLDRIDFWAIINEGQENKFIDLPDVTTFIPDSNNEYRGTFDYNFDLSILGLQPDYYNIIQLNATLYDRTGNRTSTSNSFTLYHSAPQGTANLDNETFQYAAGDILTLEDVLIEDEDGFIDLDRVEFEAIININSTDYGSTQKIIDLPDVTQFIPVSGNNLGGTFDYSIDLGKFGISRNSYSSVNLVGTIYDKIGNKGYLSLPNFDISNHIPRLISSSVESREYTVGDTLILNDAWVEDRDGINNLDRMTFDAVINGHKVIDLPDVTTFIPDLGNGNRGTFNYALDLSTLGLDAGNNYINLFGTLLDKAGNIDSSGNFDRIYHITNSLPDVSFDLDRTQYGFNDTLTITEGWVEGRIQNFKGFADVERIDLLLQFKGSYGGFNDRVIDIPDITHFTTDPNDAQRAVFNYTLDLASLGLDLAANNDDLTIETITYNKGGYGIKGEDKTFRLTNAIPTFDFRLSQNEYRLDDTLTVTDAWAEDPDGFTDLDRVTFLLHNLDNGTEIDITDVTNLIADPNNSQRGIFNYSLNFVDWGLNSGNYELEGIAYDKQNNPSVAIQQLFEILPPENAPQNLRFSLDRTTYTPNTTISFNNGWVKDEDGGDNITRIDLRLFDASDRLITDLNDITEFAIASWNADWASFNAQINLSGLNLTEGTYTISGIAYDLNNNAGNTFERNFSLEVPQNDFNPNSLRFNLDKTTYNATDRLQIRNGWISDGDGANDINRIEFKLVASNGTEIFLDSINNFIQASWSPEWASFGHSFDLSRLALSEGKYTLVGVAYDNAGQQSNGFERSLNIEIPQANNQTPTGLQFGLNGSIFSSNDTLQITNGWVNDRDGNSDLEGVNFEIVTEDGTIIDVSNSFDLAAATWDRTQQWSSFRHSINLSALGLSGGRYSLRGRAYDRAGDYSNSFLRMFAIA